MFFKALLKPGTMAPLFALMDTTGQTQYLEPLIGQKKIVLIFYPADFTPVCTQQLCMFRDNFELLTAQNIAVFGINPGEWSQHQKFSQKYQLPFPLLYDPRAKVAKAYQAEMIPGMLVQRCVYGIGLDGRIVYAQKGNPPAAAVLKAMS